MKKWFFVCALPVATAAIFSCSRPPYYATNKTHKKQAKTLAKQVQQVPATFVAPNTPPAYWVGTTNFNLRKPNFVIIHHTAQNSCEQTLKTFTVTRTQVSAHYVICKDGTVHHMLNDYLRAWHGGIAKWGSVTDINSASIGIELDNNGFEIFPEPQLNSLLILLDTLKQQHNIPSANFIGHADIAPTRKTDPNIYFPWKLLAGRGYGLWYDDTSRIQLPESFDAVQALRIVGYDVRDSSAAMLAFKRHFLADTTRHFNQIDRKVLYSIMKKSL